MDIAIVLSRDEVTVLISSLSATWESGRLDPGAPDLLMHEVASTCRRIMEAAFTMDELHYMAFVEGAIGKPLRDLIRGVGHGR